MNPSSGAVTAKNFSGKRIIVTGAGRGIGRAIALDLADLGGEVHIVSATTNAATVAREIADRGGKAQAHIGSVADEAFCKAVISDVENGPDILVNAAAILGPSGPFAGASMAAISDVIAVNLLGTCNFMRWSLPGMERRGFGRIVNFAGGGAAYAYPMFSPYGVSKVAVVRLTETVAEEVKSSGVTINVIAPGAVETDMLAEVRRNGGEVRTTVGIDEPVRLVRYLCGEESRRITGRFIHARDNYTDGSLFDDKDNMKLRRIEKW